jgi:predicted RND superfamily exporter protein
MTLAIADCIHLLAPIGQLQRKAWSHADAVAESMRINWVPVLITSVTTALGFLTLNFAESPPMQDVGTIVAVGVGAAWLLSVTFFLAFLAVLPPPRQLPLLSDPRFLDRASEAVVKHRRAILALCVPFVVLLALGIPRMTVDDDLIKYFPRSFPFRADSEFIQARLTGLHTLSYSIPSGEEGGVTEPQYLQALDAFADWFRQQDKVTHVSSITDTLRRLNRAMNGDDARFATLPESRELAAQYLLLYEMSLPANHDMNNLVDISKSRSLVTVTLSNVTTNDIRRLASEGQRWLAERGFEAPATGPSAMYAQLSDRNIRNMLTGTALELAVISCLMIVLVRSFRIGILSLIPNFVPAIICFGLWGWFGEDVNVAISVVAAMTFGIVVDDTIHSLTKYMRARRELKLDPTDAVRYTYIAAGDPMILTGLTLMMGFGVLALSGFAVTHQLGLLSVMIIGLAIVADLVMLPPLLILFDRERGPPRHGRTGG